MLAPDFAAISEERLPEPEAPAAPRPSLSLSALRHRLGRGRDVLRRSLIDEDLLPTGLAGVDGMLGGGIARGCLTELRGAPSSGRFALVVALLAATTARGEAAALVDLGDQLDPQEAKRCGVALPRLLWARPQRLHEALAAAEITLGGDFPLVVLELGMPPLPPGSDDEHAWLRLARAARQHRAALLVATPWRTSGSAAGEVLALGGRRGVWLGSGIAPRLLGGVESFLAREKSRRQPEPAAAALGLRAPGVMLPGELLPQRPAALAALDRERWEATGGNRPTVRAGHRPSRARPPRLATASGRASAAPLARSTQAPLPLLHGAPSPATGPTRGAALPLAATGPLGVSSKGAARHTAGLST